MNKLSAQKDVRKQEEGTSNHITATSDFTEKYKICLIIH